MNRSVVCERVFQMRLEDGVRPVLVQWFQPMPDQNDWRCEYQIDWPHRAATESRAIGVDSVQAMQLAMSIVAVRLYLEEPSVFWFEEDDRLGLPVEGVAIELEAKRKSPPGVQDV
ncbi:hypothetical protein D3C85_1365200 [compost metagenome]